MIPTWTWPDRGDESSAEDLAQATETFDAFSNSTRAAILGTVFDADGPIAYTELANAVDVEDNGRLNYHLRSLEDFLQHSEDGYTLTTSSYELVEDMLENDTVSTSS